MVTLKKRSRTLETPVNPKQNNTHEQQQSTVSGYEQCREQRIKENMERMQKLGLFDLSSKLKTEFPSPKRPYHRRTPQASSLGSNLPQRRSSRLQSGTPLMISYSELCKPKRARSEPRKNYPQFIGVGPRDEVYTEEHDKLLGSTEMPWTLFVDGCGPDGRRIYDQVNGKSCHQCRQKTMGYRTHCNNCRGIRGQFCGDCLYMRYGEHVLEANQNPKWICPPCRGICNCSLCRNARGWPPTGHLYRKILDLGFKSVAHYLIKTRRVDTKSDDVGTADPKKSEDVGSDDPLTVKRSLPFAETQEGADSSHDGQNDSATHKKDSRLEEKKKEFVNLDSAHGVSGISSVNEANGDSIGKRVRQKRNKSLVNSDNLLGSPVHVDNISDGLEEDEKQSLNVDIAPGVDHNVASASMASPDSIAKRLRQRQRRNRSGEHKGNSEHEVKNASNNAPGSQTKGSGKSVTGIEPQVDSIAKRLRQRCNKSDEHKGTSEHELKKAKGSGKSVIGNEPRLDSISERLRQRRNRVL